MRKLRLAALLLLSFTPMSPAFGQLGTSSNQDIRATLRTLQSTNRGVLRARRDSREDVVAVMIREQIDELRHLLGRLERESLQQGRIVPDPGITGEAGQAARRRGSSDGTVKEEVLEKVKAMRSVISAHLANGENQPQRIGFEMPAKATDGLLHEIQSELQKQGIPYFETIRKLKKKTQLKTGGNGVDPDDKTPTVSTIIKHRRDFQ